MDSGQGVLGIRLGEKWMVSLLQIYAESEDHSLSSSQVQRMTSFNWTYRMKPWSVSLGGGYFQSTIIEPEATFLLVFRYQALPALGLL